MSSTYLTGTANFWILSLIIFLRYAILASMAFVIFYILKKEAWRFKRIQEKFPIRKDYVREFLYSISTTFIFAGVGYIVFGTSLVKHTQVYYNLDEYGIGYFFFSILLTIIVHDTYFYWTHWLMHHKLVFRLFHKVHHLSTNPSPWAAMAFHPLEAIVEAGIIVVVVFLFPIHPLSIGLFLLFMMIYNVYGHLGYELYPKGFAGSLFGKWINTSINHNLHHQHFKGNYGLYFLFWDRIMGTIQKDYEAKFDAIKTQKIK